MRSSKPRIVDASCIQNIPYQRFLTIVRSQNGNLIGRIAEQSHVHIRCNNIFCFSQVLKKEVIVANVKYKHEIMKITSDCIKFSPGKSMDWALFLQRHYNL